MLCPIREVEWSFHDKHTMSCMNFHKRSLMTICHGFLRITEDNVPLISSSLKVQSRLLFYEPTHWIGIGITQEDMLYTPQRHFETLTKIDN